MNDIPFTGIFLCRKHGSSSMDTHPALSLALTLPPHQSSCSPLAVTTGIPEPAWRTVSSSWMMNLLWMSSICHATQLSRLQLPSPCPSRSYGPLQVLAGGTRFHYWINEEALAPWLMRADTSAALLTSQHPAPPLPPTHTEMPLPWGLLSPAAPSPSPDQEARS